MNDETDTENEGEFDEEAFREMREFRAELRQLEFLQQRYDDLKTSLDRNSDHLADIQDTVRHHLEKLEVAKQESHSRKERNSFYFFILGVSIIFAFDFFLPVGGSLFARLMNFLF